MGNEASQSLPLGEPIENDINVSWKKLRNIVNFPCREGQASCSVGAKLYMFGGVLTDRDDVVETNDLLVFDGASQTWSKIRAKGQVPAPRSAATLCHVDHKLYLHGGLSNSCGWFDDLHVYDTALQTWRRVEASGLVPVARDKSAATAIGKNIYLFGGFGPKSAEEFDEESEEDDEDLQEGAEFGWFNDLHMFNTETKEWSQPLQMNLGVPTPRAAHAMCAVGSDLVIFGGRDAESRVNDLHVYNTETRKWDTSLCIKGRQPEPRSFHTATAVGCRVVVTGGRGTDNQHFTDFHILDTENKQWLQPRVSGDLPCARGLHSVGLVGDHLVLFGGSGKFDKDTMQCAEHYNETYVMKTDLALK